MFFFNNTEVVEGRTEYVPFEKTIKKAPTDDSIRLYEEIKQKAYKSILDTIELKDNAVNFNAVLYKDTLSYEKVCQYNFSLNGKEFDGKIPLVI